MFSLVQLFILNSPLNFTSELSKIIEQNGGVSNGKEIFPPVSEGTEGYKLLAIIIATVALIAIIVFIFMLVKTYIKEKNESVNFGAKVKGDLQYPGYHRGEAKPVIDPDDKGVDKWGKID